MSYGICISSQAGMKDLSMLLINQARNRACCRPMTTYGTAQSLKKIPGTLD